jgi:hypothetical protein
LDFPELTWFSSLRSDKSPHPELISEEKEFVTRTLRIPRPREIREPCGEALQQEDASDHSTRLGGLLRLLLGGPIVGSEGLSMELLG